MHWNHVINNCHQKISLWNGSFIISKSFREIMWLSESCCNDLPTKIKIWCLPRLFKKGWTCSSKFNRI